MNSPAAAVNSHTSVEEFNAPSQELITPMMNLLYSNNLYRDSHLKYRTSYSAEHAREPPARSSQKCQAAIVDKHA